MSPSEEHEDLYSVSPAAMSDEQIALRDAMTVTAVDQAEKVTAVCGTLHSLLDGLCKSVERLERERNEMREVLQRYLGAYPAFRAKPMGAPGSAARDQQDRLIALEERAEKLLARG